MAWMIRWLLSTNYFTKHLPTQEINFETSPVSSLCSKISYSFSNTQSSSAISSMQNFVTHTFVPYVQKEYQIDFEPLTSPMRAFPSLCANLDFRLDVSGNSSQIIMIIQQKTINLDLINMNALGLQKYNQTTEFVAMQMPALQLLLQNSFIKTNPLSLPLQSSFQIHLQTKPFETSKNQNPEEDLFAWNITLSLFLVNAMLPIYFFANLISMIQNSSFLLPVSEREKKLESRLEMIGCNMIAYNCSWGLFSFFDAFLCITLTCVLLWSCNLLQFTNFFLFYFIYLLAAVCCIPILLLCNYWFSTVKMATTFSSLLLTLFVPCWIIVNRIIFFVGRLGPLPSWLLQLLCHLFPPFAFLDFMLYSSSIEFYNSKRQQKDYIYLSWNNLFTNATPSGEVEMDFNLFICIALLLWNSILFQFVHIYFSRLIPRQYGIPEHWNFIFKKEFWRPFFSSSNASLQMDSIEDLELQSEQSEMGIELKHIYKTYTSGLLWNKKTTVAVDGLSLNIAQNQIFGLLGANGSGKTTTCNIIAGVIAASYGQVLINHSLNLKHDTSAIRKLIGYVPQEDVMFEKLTGYEHLKLFATIKGVPITVMQQQIREELESIGLAEHQNKMVTHFSGGMKRRLNFALAMIGNPKLLILDEVTTGTDASNKRKIWNILQEYKKKYGVTILLTSHSMEEVEYLCDSIAILKHGKLHVSGTTLELKNHFEIGYSLSIMMKQTNEHIKEQIKQLVLQTVQDSKMVEEASSSQQRLVFYLPNAKTAQFVPLLRQLDQQKEELQVEFYHLNANTLEEAFLKSIGTDSASE